MNGEVTRAVPSLCREVLGINFGVNPSSLGACQTWSGSNVCEARPKSDRKRLTLRRANEENEVSEVWSRS